MCMKLDDITLNYVEKQADGNYQNAETTIPAAMGVMTAFNASVQPGPAAAMR